jgi:hypothetical protein
MVKHLFDDGNLYGGRADGRMTDEPGEAAAAGRAWVLKAGFARQAGRVSGGFLVILGVVQHNPTTRSRAFYRARPGFTALGAATLSLSV